MRRLIYVPIIHTEADLGSMASALEARSAALCGQGRWAKHKETVAEFWQRVADYLDRLEVTNLKIYQDGLVADGELGRRIVEEGARRGSQNYQIILNLLVRGAEMRKTEHVSLLQEEYARLAELAQAQSLVGKAIASAKHQRRKNRLTKERDRFVAKTISETLREGEVGLLFMGAYHDVLSHLPPDIVAEEVKEQARVRTYFEAITREKSDDEFGALARYLTTPVELPQRSRQPSSAFRLLPRV